MLRTVLKVLIALLIACILTILWAITFNKPEQFSYSHYGLPINWQTVQQNWTADIRQQVSHTNFGSRILPLDWLLNLEHPTKEGYLRDSQHMNSLGFIAQQHTTNNTYGLPLGFSIDEYEGTQWAGLTCAACHTGLISYGGQTVLIDGGSSLLNFAQFESDILGAVEQTLIQPQRLERLGQKIQIKNLAHLKNQLEQYRDSLGERLANNATSTPYGHGRLDAFGMIFNSIAAQALNIPDNARSPDAPVSIPVLWDASHHDLVQWNGSAPNKEPGPLGQNIPTAIAVYGQVNISPNRIGGYASSVNIKNLGYLQKQYYKLTSPSWPSSLFGEIDYVKADHGKNIYNLNCQHCHLVIDHLNPKRQIKSTLIDIEEVGTDPTMANNFVNRRVSSGKLQGTKIGILAGYELDEHVAPIELVINATIGSMLNQPLSTLTAIATEYANNLSAPLDFTRKAYRARPLNGIWSSAPYLHNGSVPTLWDLLQPPHARTAFFYVGNHELDITKVGFKHSQAPNTTAFDTSLFGNSNEGHTYGTQLTTKDKWALIEYLKTL